MCALPQKKRIAPLLLHTLDTLGVNEKRGEKRREEEERHRYIQNGS